MVILTSDQKKKYVNEGGVRCPICFSEYIQGGFIEADQGTASQKMICNECGAQWTDEYTLTGMSQD